jgi:hypothetical protein
MLSPHIEVHTERVPILLMHVYPISGTQLVEHPILFPLSHF